MIRQDLSSFPSSFKWVDITDPDDNEMMKLSKEFQIPSGMLINCFGPELAPKCENFQTFDHIVIRIFDSNSSSDSDTIQELTNKMIFFVSEKFIITIHRFDFDFMDGIKRKWESENYPEIHSPFHIVWEIFNQAMNSYETPIEQAMLLVDEYETEVFNGTTNQSILQELYILKRNASVFKRMIHLTKEIIVRLEITKKEHEPLIQELRLNTDRLKFLSDQLQENATSLLNLHLSISSHRTNEVIRILTVFSVFFLPLTFIVGVYGMNFKFMPELENHWGYPLIWVAMISVTAGIFFWFRKNGWLKFK